MFKDAALTCFSRVRTVAMVVDIGEHFTRCCGVIDGFVDRENVVMQRFGAHRIRSLALQKCIIPAIHGHEMKLPGCVRFCVLGSSVAAAVGGWKSLFVRFDCTRCVRKNVPIFGIPIIEVFCVGKSLSICAGRRFGSFGSFGFFWFHGFHEIIKSDLIYAS